jgi:hypothetical protein
MHKIEIYIRKNGSYGYRIYEDGAIRIEQPIAPGLPGFVAMTEGQAQAYAAADVEALEAPQPETETEQA